MIRFDDNPSSSKKADPPRRAPKEAAPPRREPKKADPPRKAAKTFEYVLYIVRNLLYQIRRLLFIH